MHSLLPLFPYCLLNLKEGGLVENELSFDNNFARVGCGDIRALCCIE